MNELFYVFINVVMPVFGIVLLGYLLGTRLQLQAQTLTRVAYYVFVPAFIFQAISHSGIQLADAIRMLGFILLTHLAAAFIAGGVARLLGRSREMIAAFVMIAVFGNVGNYGLAMIRFRLGEAAVAPATIYFVVITITAFVVCVSAAGWAHGGGRGALSGLVKTPALWATVPALLVSNSDVSVPLLLSRMIGLLADAMIPVMLFALGLQLLEQRRVNLSLDVFLASANRLLLAPVLAVLIAIPFGLGPVEYAAGVLQAAMPTAILVAIISKENNVVPEFVTSVVLVSTLISLVTLSVLMVLL
jgi:predicted permease